MLTVPHLRSLSADAAIRLAVQEAERLGMRLKMQSAGLQRHPIEVSHLSRLLLPVSSALVWFEWAFQLFPLTAGGARGGDRILLYATHEVDDLRPPILGHIDRCNATRVDSRRRSRLSPEQAAG